MTINQQRTTKQQKATTAQQYRKVIGNNLSLLVTKPKQAVANNFSKAETHTEKMAAAITSPLYAGIGVGKAVGMVAKRGFKGAKNLPDNQAIKDTASHLKNGAQSTARVAMDFVSGGIALAASINIADMFSNIDF